MHYLLSLLLYVFIWVIPRRLNFICRRFGTLCLFHLYRQVGVDTYLSIKMEQTECSETSAYKIQTRGNYPEESIQHSSMLFEKWQIFNNTRFQPPDTTVLRLLDLDNVHTMTLRNVGKCKPIDTASHLRKKN